MVVFTCNNCGDSLQKPKVAKHYQFQCRSSENLTCVDCHKDFYGQEYVAHTKCITESERYGGANYIPRPGQNKGERKQQEWINIVKKVIETANNLSKDESSLLNILDRHDNIPRKKAKFLNFIRSVMGNRVNMLTVDSVWNRMETAFKSSSDLNNSQNKSVNEKIAEEVKENVNGVENHENNIAENQNNENISRENGGTVENGAEAAESVTKKKKKSKKRELAESDSKLEEQPQKKKKKTEEIIDDAVAQKMNENDVEKPTKFDWKATILEIVGSHDGISMKKLRKKVSNRYVNHSLNSVTFEKATSRFDKKIVKITEVTINDDKVTLS